MSTRRKPLKAKRAVSLRPTRRPSRDEPSPWDMGRPGRTHQRVMFSLRVLFEMCIWI